MRLGEVRVVLHGLPVMFDGPGAVAFPHKNQRQVVVARGVVFLQFQSFAQAVFRLLQPVEVHQRVGEMAACGEIFGIGRKRLPEFGNRRLGFALPLQQQAEVAPRLEFGRVRCQRQTQAGFGFCQFALFEEGPAEVGVGLGVMRLQVERLAPGGGGASGLSGTVQAVAEQQVRFGKIRGDFQGAAHEVVAFLVLALQVEQDAEQVQRFQAVGVVLQEAAVQLFRFFVLAALVQAQGQVKGVIRGERVFFRGVIHEKLKEVSDELRCQRVRSKSSGR